MRLLLTIIISSMALLSRGDNALTQTDLLYLFPNKAIDGTGLMGAQTFNFRVIRK